MACSVLPTLAVVRLAYCALLLVLSLPSSMAAQPVAQFQVFASVDCTGPLFELDTNWQWFTSLNSSQVQLRSASSTGNSTGTPCISNPAAGIASAIFTCFDDESNPNNVGGNGVVSAQSGASATGWSQPGCVNSNADRVFQYSANNNGNTTSAAGCQQGTVICPACNSKQTVGMLIQCGASSTPNSAVAVMQRASTSLLLVSVLLALYHH